MDISCTEDNARHYYWERLAEEYKESLCTIFATFCDSIISKQKGFKCMAIYSVRRTEEHSAEIQSLYSKLDKKEIST